MLKPVHPEIISSLSDHELIAISKEIDADIPLDVATSKLVAFAYEIYGVDKDLTKPDVLMCVCSSQLAHLIRTETTNRLEQKITMEVVNV